MATSVHQIAKAGFGAGTNELYDRARPSYRPEALAHIRAATRGPAPLNVVEVGSGTGIFTRALLADHDWNTALGALRAVEPSEGMRAQFASTVADTRVSVAEGTFDTTGVPDGWADLVIVAQAFHWCPDYDKAAREFARVLKPDGVVALIWNLEDRDRAKWTAQLRDVYEKHEKNTPQFRLGLWRATFDTAGYKEGFESPEETVFTYNLLGTEDIVINRVLSKSYIAVLTDEEKAKVIGDLKAVLAKGDELVWTDKDKGEFEYPYNTLVIIAKKK